MVSPPCAAHFLSISVLQIVPDVLAHIFVHDVVALNS